jgi:hypothetical protein
MATPCFQHDSYRRDCGDCRDMNGDDLPPPMTDTASLVSRLREGAVSGSASTCGEGYWHNCQRCGGTVPPNVRCSCLERTALKDTQL